MLDAVQALGRSPSKITARRSPNTGMAKVHAARRYSGQRRASSNHTTCTTAVPSTPNNPSTATKRGSQRMWGGAFGEPRPQREERAAEEEGPASRDHVVDGAEAAGDERPRRGGPSVAGLEQWARSATAGHRHNTRPVKRIAKPATVCLLGRSASSAQAGSTMSSGCALASTEATPVERCSAPTYMAAAPTVALASPSPATTAHSRTPRGIGRRRRRPRATSAAPATRARSVASHSAGGLHRMEQR